MSLVDTFTKPARGRKPADASMSPVAAALSQPLPAELAAAMTTVRVARDRYSEASSAHSDARFPAVQNGNAVKKASEALAEAAVLVEMRHPDAPSEEEIAELQTALARAKASDNETGARVQALAQYKERCAEEWRAAYTAFDEVFEPWKKDVLGAVDRQLREAMPPVVEAFAAAKAVTEYWKVETEAFDPSDIYRTEAAALPLEANAAIWETRRFPPFK